MFHTIMLIVLIGVSIVMAYFNIKTIYYIVNGTFGGKTILFFILELFFIGMAIMCIWTFEMSTMSLIIATWIVGMFIPSFSKLAKGNEDDVKKKSHGWGW